MCAKFRTAVLAAVILVLTGLGLYGQLISEIYYQTHGSRYYGQWIEVYNDTGTFLDLSDLRLGTISNQASIIAFDPIQADLTLSRTSLRIPPGTYSVILDPGFTNGECWDLRDCYIASIDRSSFSEGAYLKPGDHVCLFDDDDRLLDESGPLPLLSIENGFSVERIDFNLKDLNCNFALSHDSPTPGRINSSDGLYNHSASGELTIRSIQGSQAIIGCPWLIELVHKNETDQIPLFLSFQNTITYPDGIKMFVPESESFYKVPHENQLDLDISAGRSGRFYLRSVSPGRQTVLIDGTAYSIDFQEFNSPLSGLLHIYGLRPGSSRDNLVLLKATMDITSIQTLKLSKWNDQFESRDDHYFRFPPMSEGSLVCLANDASVFPTADLMVFIQELDLNKSGYMILYDENGAVIDSSCYDGNAPELRNDDILVRRTLSVPALDKDCWQAASSLTPNPGLIKAVIRDKDIRLGDNCTLEVMILAGDAGTAVFDVYGLDGQCAVSLAEDIPVDQAGSSRFSLDLPADVLGKGTWLLKVSYTGYGSAESEYLIDSFRISGP